MNIKEKLNDKKTEKRKKKLQKKAYLKGNVKECCLAKVEYVKGSFASVVYEGEAICDVKDGIAYDKLTKNNTQYKIFEGPEETRKAIKEGKLSLNEVYCSSYYSYEDYFPEIEALESYDEIVEILVGKNLDRQIPIKWSFIDEEIEEKNKVKTK